MHIANLINNIVVPKYSKTNHAEAFRLATTILKDNPGKDQVVIMFTDGETTTGEEPNTYVRKLKQMGVKIFCIGLVDKDTNLRAWSSLPLKEHMLSTRDPSKLVGMFNKISYEVAKAGAKDVIINEKLNEYFRIVSIDSPTFGSTSLIDEQTFTWNIDAFGIDEEAICNFDIEYIGKTIGMVDVNKSITYIDRDNNNLIFPNPSIYVIKENIIIVNDNCNEEMNIVNGDYQGVIETDIKDLGRIIKVNVIIRKVCPNKKIALGVILTEVDKNDIEYNRGVKNILIEPIISDKCEDILVKCIDFSVSEKLDKSGNINHLCNPRNFKVRVIVNYIDSDFVCSIGDSVILK